jgi:hypothetical protein
VAMADRRIPIPRVKNPNAVKWYAGTCVACLAMIGYLALIQPQNLPWAALALAPLLLPLLLFTRTQWLDPESGTVGQTLLGFRQWSATLSPELPVALVDSGNGCLQLSLGRFPRRIFIPLLRLDVYDHASQEPSILRLLAEQIGRGVPAKQELANRLNRQADHVATGGRPDSSPLASLLVKHSVNPLPGRVRRHD